MKKILLLLCCLAGLFSPQLGLKPQASVFGVVSDDKKQLIPGASVLVRNEHRLHQQYRYNAKR